MGKYFEAYKDIYDGIKDETKIKDISLELLGSHKELINNINNDILNDLKSNRHWEEEGKKKLIGKIEDIISLMDKTTSDMEDGLVVSSKIIVDDLKPLLKEIKDDEENLIKLISARDTAYNNWKNANEEDKSSKLEVYNKARNIATKAENDIVNNCNEANKLISKISSLDGYTGFNFSDFSEILGNSTLGIPLSEYGITSGVQKMTINGQKCQVWIPNEATTDMPLTVFLDGSGMSLTGGLPNILTGGKEEQISLDTLGTIVIAPIRDGNPNGSKNDIKVIQEAIKTFNSDQSKIALAGYSWGGSMALDLVLLEPSLFSNVVLSSSSTRMISPNSNKWKAFEGLNSQTVPQITFYHDPKDNTHGSADDSGSTTGRYTNIVSFVKYFQSLGYNVSLVDVTGGHVGGANATYKDANAQKDLFLKN